MTERKWRNEGKMFAMLIAGLLVFIISLFFINRYRDIFHPLFIFILPFIIEFILDYTVYRDEKISMLTSVLVAGSILFFSASYLFFQYLFERTLRYNYDNYASLYIGTLTRKIINLLTVVGFVAVLYEIYRITRYSGGISSIYQAMRLSINYDEGYGFLAKYIPVLYNVYYAYYIYNMDEVKPPKQKIVIYTILFAFFAFTAFNRTNIIMSLLVFGYCYLYKRKEEYFAKAIEGIKTAIKIIIIVVAVLALFIWISNATNKTGNMVWSNRDFFLWRYFGYPVITLDKRIIGHPGISSGYYFLGFIGNLLEQNGVIDSAFESVLPRLGTFNVFTSMGRLYLDFGLIGTFLAELFLGALTAFIYVSNIHKGGRYTIYYAFFLYSLIMAFYDYQFSLTIYLYILVSFAIISFTNKLVIGGGIECNFAEESQIVLACKYNTERLHSFPYFYQEANVS